jgi:hypothetical protein
MLMNNWLLILFQKASGKSAIRNSATGWAAAAAVWKDHHPHHHVR